MDKGFIYWITAIGVVCIGIVFIVAGLIRPSTNYVYMGIGICLLSILLMFKSIQIALKEEKMLDGV